MNRRLSILLCGLTLTACATTPDAADIVTELSSSIRPIKQNTDSSLETALSMQRAQAATDAQNHDESFDIYQLIALKEPDNLDARIGWGNAAIALNFFEKAHEIFSNETGLEAATKTQESAHLAGLVLAEIGTGRARDEEVRLNEALEYNLHDTRLWNALGRFHDNREQWVQAQRTYLKALNTGEQAQSSVVNNLGMSFLKQGIYDVALEKFEQASEIQPLRELYDNNRRLTLALMEEFDAAVEDAPDNRVAEIFNDAGYIALSQNKTSIAQSLLKRSIELSPSFNPDAIENLNALEFKLDDTTEDISDSLQKVNEHVDWGELLP